MAIGRTNAGAGGSGGVNFKVVGGTVSPTNPKENTIWVTTDVAIPSWAFSATEPGSPVEGMVWISTGTSSGGAFNALKNNVLTVYPSTAKQYINGDWVAQVAKSYQDGAWHRWILYLYNNGGTCTENGGEWVAAGKNISSEGGGSNTLTIKLNSGSMDLTQSKDAYGGIAYKKKAIDLTKISTINIKGKKSEALSLNTWTSLNVWTSLGTYIASNRAAYLNFGTTNGTFNFNLDVSGLTGEYYIGFGLYKPQTLTITEVSLK